MSIEGWIYIALIGVTAWLYGNDASADESEKKHDSDRPLPLEPEWSEWIWPVIFGVFWPIMLPLWLFNKFFNE